MLSKIVQTTKK